MKPKIKIIGLLLVIFALNCQFSVAGISTDQIVDLVNRDREAHGLNDLAIDPKLNLAALAKAQDMVNRNYFAHTSPEGSSPWDFIISLGYNYVYAGENLAVGFNDPKELLSQWMASDAHRANILSHNYQDTGIAVVEISGTPVVVQMFGSRSSAVSLR